MQLIVNTLTGNPIAVDVRTSNTTDVVKVNIQRQTGIPPEQQRITLRGKTLKNGRRLSDYDICSGPTVHHLCLHSNNSKPKKLVGRSSKALQAEAQDAFVSRDPTATPALAQDTLSVPLLHQTTSEAEDLPDLIGVLHFILMGMADKLPLSDLVQFGACCNYTHCVATRSADRLVKLQMKSVHLLNKRILGSHTHQEMPNWVQRKAALKPFCLGHGFDNDWQDQTRPVPFVLDSRGPVFVEFQLIAAKAPNGTPTLGLVDAASLAGSDSGLTRDISRWQDEAKSFAMAFSPGWGCVFASIDGVGPTRLHDSGINPNGSTGALSAGTYKANLNWSSLGDETAKWNLPIQCGFFLENRNLTFYRMDEYGFWQSTGILCRSLPERVVPSMFMFSFMGYAQVWMAQVWDCPPKICPGCDSQFHGTQEGWSRFGP
jgi:hypothetical protein